MKNKLFLLISLAIITNSCFPWIERDGLLYGMRFEGVVDGEERIYEIPELRQYGTQSDVCLELYGGENARFYLDFEAHDTNRKTPYDRDFGVYIDHKINDSFFVEGEQYVFDSFGYPFDIVEEGWFSLSLSPKPGVAFSVSFEIVFPPSQIERYHRPGYILGTIEVTEDFLRGCGTYKNFDLLLKIAD